MNIITQGIKDGQRQTRWHKWFLLAITPLSFAYCALFPFSPETGPSLGHIIGFLPVVAGSLAWAFLKAQPQFILNVRPFSHKTRLASQRRLHDIEGLQVRLNSLTNECHEVLPRIKKERQKMQEIRTNCIKMRPAFQKRGRSAQVQEAIWLQKKSEQSISEWNDLEKRIFSSLEKIRDIESEINDENARIQMSILFGELKTLAVQIATTEKMQEDVEVEYKNLQQQKTALA